MKRLLCVLCLMFCLTGCVTLQIKNDAEVLSPTGFIVDSMASYIRIKYAPHIDTYLSLSDKVINADTDAMAREAYRVWIGVLCEGIKDPFLQDRAKAILNSFEVDINGDPDLDMGALRVARELVEKFRKGLEG